MFFMLASAALYVLETAILLAFLKQGCFAKFCCLNALLHNNKFKPFHVGLACNTIKYEV